MWLPVCHHFRPSLRTHARRMSRSAEAHAFATGKASNSLRSLPSGSTPSFAELGLHPPIVEALRAAFDINKPTDIQSELIPAILKGTDDILLKDHTGSGKSFGILMALLSKPRLRATDAVPGTPSSRKITSLFVVPHRDLAFQLLWWVQQMIDKVHKAPPISSIAQVCVRDGATHLTAGLELLRTSPPHVLIGTPHALMDIFQEDATALQLEHLSTVVVDEVDYLIESGYSVSEYTRKKIKKRIDRHPEPTKRLLDTIYIPSDELQNTRAASHPRQIQDQNEHKPQLIMSSATLRTYLRRFLYHESGWFKSGTSLKIAGDLAPGAKTSGGRLKTDGLGGTSVSHYVLTVSDHGEIKNIDNAVTALDTAHAQPELQSEPDHTQDEEILDKSIESQYASNPSPYNLNALEAIATVFALDVPHVAILVLHSSAPVLRAVYDLRQLGVKARALNLNAGRGVFHLLQSNRDTSAENPVLYVATLSTIRGLDLPQLSHVFMLGIPAGPRVNSPSLDAYVHIAGRVGRFRRKGKIFTIVEETPPRRGNDEGNAPLKEYGDVQRMKKILETLQITPMRFDFP